jgi:hypothetical protein
MSFGVKGLSIHPSTWRHIPADRNLRQRRQQHCMSCILGNRAILFQWHVQLTEGDTAICFHCLVSIVTMLRVGWSEDQYSIPVRDIEFSLPQNMKTGCGCNRQLKGDPVPGIKMVGAWTNFSFTTGAGDNNLRNYTLYLNPCVFSVLYMIQHDSFVWCCGPDQKWAMLQVSFCIFVIQE